MRVTARELVDLRTSLAVAEWYIRRMPRSPDRLHATKILRGAWKVAARLTDENINRISPASLEKLKARRF